jgi:DNA-directed RNA polymerase specialized sigma24 family protein
MTVIIGYPDEERVDTLALAVAGDESAFARIVASHHASMTKVCYLVCGDLDLADEAVAAAWPLAWRHLHSVRDPDRLGPWLVSVAANEARQLMRRNRRRSLREIPADEASAGTVSDPAARAAGMDLIEALARLSPDDRTLLDRPYRHVPG